MKIKALVENTTFSENLKTEHGLSLYIEARRHKILFDMGASSLFAENAEKMGVNLAEVDIAFISHGHYDHGGGLRKFLKVNKQANIYVHPKAFDKYYGLQPKGDWKDIGLDETLAKHPRLIYAAGRTRIDEELSLFSAIADRQNLSQNKELYRMSAAGKVQDGFAHEQNLVIREEGKILLVAGCAHRGIASIVKHVWKHLPAGETLSHVIGGFHLYSIASGRSEEPGTVDKIARYLKSTGFRYYTCHCTGSEAYKQLKTIMGDQIQYLAAGSQITI